VLEYCNGKTLEEYLKKKKKIPEEEAVAILRQIINGLAVFIILFRSCIKTALFIGILKLKILWNMKDATK